MLKPGSIAIAAVLLSAMSGSAAAAPRRATLTLEDRVLASDLVVVGRIVSLDDNFGLTDPPGMLRGKIMVDRTLKGDHEGRVVEFLYRNPPADPRAVREAPPIYRMDQEEVWLLKRHETLAGHYLVVAPHQAEPPSRAETIAKVIAAAADPLKALREADNESRLRLSAAYIILREAVPASQVPAPKPDNQPANGTGDAPPRGDAGYELLDAAVLDKAVRAAADTFAAESFEVNELSRRTLARVGCPVDALEPPLPAVRATTTEQIRLYQKTHQDAWAAAIRKWWTDHRDAITRYVPKPPPRSSALPPDSAGSARDAAQSPAATPGDVAPAAQRTPSP